MFNRPEQTGRVFERIRAAKPARLYVAADGPRPDRADEASRCAQVRQIATRIDWSCDLFTLFRQKNLGCALAVSGALSWFFEQESEGIVLEDDCLPDQSFFAYCTVLLQHYRDDQRIGQVCGFNLLPESSPSAADYFPSHFGWSWGWASWRRSWAAYDLQMTSWSRLKQQKLHRQHPFYPQRLRLFDQTREKLWRETWDYQWHYTLASQGQLSMIPAISLVQNIGFTSDATHTFSTDPRRSKPASPLKVDHNIRHPEFMLADPQYESALIKAAHAGAWRQRILGRVRRGLSRLRLLK